MDEPRDMRKVLSRGSRRPASENSIAASGVVAASEEVALQRIHVGVLSVRYLSLGEVEIAGLVRRIDAALFLGVSVDTLDRAFQNGEIARVVVGEANVMYQVDDLLEYIAAHREYAGKEPR
jgi:hypothetical protein